MKITILGRIPSKKNSRINTRSGRSFPSKAYSEWHRSASFQISPLKNTDVFKNVGQIEIKFWLPDNRRCDLTNKAESIMDLLVDNGLLEDDCWQITGPVYLIPMGIDKDHPRVEIEY